MLARVSKGAKGWEDNKVYTNEGMEQKARDVLYGEGRGSRKSVPNMVFVNRDTANRGYNTIAFGDEVQDEEQKKGYIECFDLLSRLVKVTKGNSWNISDWGIYENYGKMVFRFRYCMEGQETIYAVQSLIASNEDDDAVLSDREGLLESLGCVDARVNIANVLLDTLDTLITKFFLWLGSEEVPVNSLYAYRLNPVENDVRRVYKGFGQATFRNYADIVMDNPDEYRMTIMVED